MAQLIKYVANVRGIRDDYPSSGSSIYINCGYFSGRVENFYLHLSAAINADLSGRIVDSAYLKVKQIAGGYSYGQTTHVTLHEDAADWFSIDWTHQPAATAAGTIDKYMFDNVAVERNIDVTSIVQWIVANNSTAHIFKLSRQVNSESGTLDGKVFSNVPSDHYLEVNHSSALAAPAAPSTPVATWVDGTHASLAWTNNDSGGAYASITIEVSTGGAYSDLVTDLGPTTVSYTPTIAKGNTYTYRIKAVNATGTATSAASNAVGAVYVVTFTNVPSGCSVVCEHDAVTASANRGASSTIDLDASALTFPLSRVAVFTQPDLNGEVLCEILEATIANMGDGDTFDVGGTDDNYLRIKVEEGAASATVDLGPTRLVVDAAEVSMPGLLKVIYPVGGIYISTLSTNPATLLGFGTWEAFATGKTIMGVDTGDTDFHEGGHTGGSKSAVVLSHTHTTKIHTGLTMNAATGSSSFQVKTLGSDPSRDANIGVADTGNQNLPPYIVVYMWKRTA